MTNTESTLASFNAALAGKRVIAGTGSRRFRLLSLADQGRILNEVAQGMGLDGDKDVICSGGAEGFDEGLAYLAQVYAVDYVLALPSPDYGPYYWGAHSVTDVDRSEDFAYLCSQARAIHFVCPSHQWGAANRIRNQFMVDIGHTFVAYTGVLNSPGTSDALRRIRASGKPLHTFH